MGVLADVFVSTEEDARLYDARVRGDAEPAPDRYEVVQYKRLTGLNFGTLWAILEGEVWSVKKHVLRHLWHNEEGESGLDEFQPRLVELLSELPEARISDVSASWGATDELRWPREAAIPIIHELRRLARLSQSRNLRMFLWNSL